MRAQAKPSTSDASVHHMKPVEAMVLAALSLAVPSTDVKIISMKTIPFLYAGPSSVQLPYLMRMLGAKP